MCSLLFPRLKMQHLTDIDYGFTITSSCSVCFFWPTTDQRIRKNVGEIVRCQLFLMAELRQVCVWWPTSQLHNGTRAAGFYF